MTKAEEALQMLIEKNQDKKSIFYPDRLDSYFSLKEERVDNTLTRTFEDGSTLVSTFSETNYPGEEVETFIYEGGFLNFLYWGLLW